MSVSMSFHFPNKRESVEDIVWSCRDHLMIEQDYVFMGHIVDMSAYRSENEKIPEAPVVITRKITGHHEHVSLKIGSIYSVSNDSLYICRASEFAKIPDAVAFRKNSAVLGYVKSIKPQSWVIINVSW